jgi:hypothetical protein
LESASRFDSGPARLSALATGSHSAPAWPSEQASALVTALVTALVSALQWVLELWSESASPKVL